MRKRHPAKGGAVQLGGELRTLTKNSNPRQLIDGLTHYQAMRLVHFHAVSPDLAVMLAALAFGGRS